MGALVAALDVAIAHPVPARLSGWPPPAREASPDNIRFMQVKPSAESRCSLVTDVDVQIASIGN